MKTINYIFSRIYGLLYMSVATLVFLLTCISCSDEDGNEQKSSDPDAGYITLILHNSSLRTRAADDEDNNFNEDKLVNARIYFFQNNAASDEDEPVFQHTEDFPAGTSDSAPVKIKLTREIKEAIFPDTLTRAKVYVVANLPIGTEISVNPTLEDLKAIKITSNFESSVITYNADTKAQLQQSFVMNNDRMNEDLSTVYLKIDEDNPSKSAVKGTVNLNRTAAKISLDVKLHKETEDAYGNKWTPVPGSMRVLLNNGVKSCTVTPELYTIEPDNDYFNTTNANAHYFGTAIDDTETTQTTSMRYPFYTYPNSWTENNAMMTYLNVMVPWTNENGVIRNCWYMVPLLRDQTSITRNTSYKVSVEIGVLGSYTPDEPLELDASIRAVKWGSAPIDGSIADYRYLVVDQESFVLNNEASVNIPIYSSHDFKVSDVKMTYYLYNTNALGIEKAVTVTMTQEKETEEKNNGEGIYSYTEVNEVDPVTGTRRLEFNHPLIQWTPYSSNNIVVPTGPDENGNYSNNLESNIDNSIAYYRPTSSPAYSVYEFEITIAQEGNKDYAQTIKIVQYPAMYIETDKNPGATFGMNVLRPNNQQTIVRGNFGYAFVNAERRTGNDIGNNPATYWNCISYGSLLGLDYASNNGNPNMYVITISQLDASSGGYIIGDPRSTTIDNLNNQTTASADQAYWGTGNTRCNEAPDMDGKSRTLLYYYPTNENEDARMIVAPKLRIASSFAEMIWNVSKFNCKRRCATYQEQGYPAGRWRVPTYGEMKYIVELTLAGKIPKLYNTAAEGEETGRYLTAQGVYQVNSTTGKLTEYKGSYTTCFVRPVYDEWYWTTDTLEFDESQPVGLQYIYTFGDKKRVEISN